MMTTRSEPSSRTMVRATRVLPDPEPPAIPIRIRRPVIMFRTVASAPCADNARRAQCSAARGQQQSRAVRGIVEVVHPALEARPMLDQALAIERPERLAAPQLPHRLIR